MRPYFEQYRGKRACVGTDVTASVDTKASTG
jgi:hypothetical protein